MIKEPRHPDPESDNDIGHERSSPNRYCCPARSRLRRKRDGFLVSLAFDVIMAQTIRAILFKSAMAATLVGFSRQQRREPGPMPGAMDLGVADDGECSGHEQATQIAIPCDSAFPFERQGWLLRSRSISGHFPVHFIPAHNLPVYASQRPLPDATEESGSRLLAARLCRGCYCRRQTSMRLQKAQR